MRTTEILASADLRITPQRLAILEELQSTVSHPDADWIYQRLKQKYPSLSPATVYKTLNRLQEKGLIQVLQVEDASLHYDANANDHPHVVCTNCGKVEDIIGTNSKEDMDLVSENSGYNIYRLKKIYYGICPQCQRDK